MMAKKILIVVFVSLFALTGCNIFGWLYPEDTESGDSATQKLQGDTAMQKGDLNSALNYYADAVSSDTKNSQARWGYVQAYVMLHNVDIIMLASKFASGNDPADIITEFAGNLVTTMNTIVSYLDPIANGQCDGVISQYDINVNGNLMLAYFIRGFLGNADSNGDGNYFSTAGAGGGDIMVFDDSGGLTYNAAVVDIDNLQTSLNSLYDDLSTSVLDPTNNPLPRSVVSNIIVTTHNLTEDLMFVYKTFGSSFGDFTKAVGAFNNISQGLPDSDIFLDFKNQVDEQYNTMNGYLAGADEDTAKLNYDHFMMVGYNMNGYSGGTPPSRSYKWTDYENFVKSDFSSHSPTATTYETGKTNYLYLLSNHSGDYLTNASIFSNDWNFLNDLFMSVESVFTDVANANLIKNLTGGAF